MPEDDQLKRSSELSAAPGRLCRTRMTLLDSLRRLGNDTEVPMLLPELP